MGPTEPPYSKTLPARQIRLVLSAHSHKAGDWGSKCTCINSSNSFLGVNRIIGSQEQAAHSVHKGAGPQSHASEEHCVHLCLRTWLQRPPFPVSRLDHTLTSLYGLLARKGLCLWVEQSVEGQVDGSHHVATRQSGSGVILCSFKTSTATSIYNLWEPHNFIHARSCAHRYSCAYTHKHVLINALFILHCFVDVTTNTQTSIHAYYK